MMPALPDVDITELQNALGIVPPGADDIMVVIGCSSQGPINTPAAYGTVAALVADFGQGPMVEEAALVLNGSEALTSTGTPVVVCRTPSTTPGACGAPDVSGVQGNAGPHVAANGAAFNAYEVYLLIVKGGTLGTAGITFQWSLTNGRNLSPITDLGTGLTFQIPNSNVTITFGQVGDTFQAKDVIRVLTTEPVQTAADITAACTAVLNGMQEFGFLQIAGPMAATEEAAIATALDAMRTNKKFRWAIWGARGPNPGESELVWSTAIETNYAAVQRPDIAVCAGTWWQTSAVDGLQYTRRITGAVAARIASIPIHIDAAKVALGPLKSGTLFDGNANLIGHDERVTPGLNTSNRFIALRTFTTKGRAAYISNPLLMSAPGSDFDLVQKRRVMNVLERVVYDFSLTIDLSAEGAADPVTGFILETTARDIEGDIRTAIRDALGPAISNPDDDRLFILSRTDPVLTNGGDLTASSRIEPLFYIKNLKVTTGFTAGSGG